MKELKYVGLKYKEKYGSIFESNEDYKLLTAGYENEPTFHEDLKQNIGEVWEQNKENEKFEEEKLQ